MKPSTPETNDLTPSGNCLKPQLANRFFFRYKSRGENFNVVIESNNIKNAMIIFLDGYHQIEEIYSIYQI